MKKTIAIASATALIALAATGIAWSDNDREKEHGRGSLAAPANATYRSECGACHLAFPPGLLPSQAWSRVMGSLDKHYGDDATLDPATADELLGYLQAHAADKSGRIRARAFAAAPKAGETLPRITEAPYFKREHHEIPARLVTGNPQVGGFSACGACHQGAEQGRFDEDGVSIPGAGRWDD